MHRYSLPKDPELGPFPSYLHETITLPHPGTADRSRDWSRKEVCGNVHYHRSRTQMTGRLILLLFPVARYQDFTVRLCITMQLIEMTLN